MEHPFAVHVALLAFNFLASVIQGITGFGDAILLQVVWFTASELAPDIFNKTPLGISPVKAVTLLMYCRIIFSAPVLAYLSFGDGIFSLQMTLAMAVPSTLTALAGMFVFRGADGDSLKLVLGVSSLVFAVLYVVILAAKLVMRRRKLQQLHSTGAPGPNAAHATAVTIIPESAAVQADWNSNRRRSEWSGDGGVSQEEEAAEGAEASPTFVSTTSGSPFTRREAVPRSITESAAAPPLTPSKMSPTRTLVYTRVRVNRNLTEEGKIKISTKVGAACAATVSGLMGSLTGVGAPPQIIFILLFDVPAYIFRVNFSVQSIPSAAIRFIFACSTGMLTKDMVPLFFTSVVGGYAGLVAGVMLGKVLGPKSYNVFVLALLLLSSLIMITTSVMVLMSFTAVGAIVTVGVAVYERRQTGAKVAAQHAAQLELEASRSKADAAFVDAADCAPSLPQCPRPTRRSTEGDEDGHNASVVSDAALSDRGSVSTFSGSGRSSNRVRRSDLLRPPPLWNDNGEPAKSPFPAVKAAATAAAAGRRGADATPPLTSRVSSSIVVCVPSAAELGKTTVTVSEAVASSPLSRPHGMCAEEVQRWVTAQDEELLHPTES
ncbi:hypothetical protein NESM_000742200 [Novymonas esmeraldas]|uniref:Uncharacterized protein n=1 Tax=Novymonas esmeraldas TaxID=1808958 RepID=A0AAW0EYA4_9TRYP